MSKKRQNTCLDAALGYLTLRMRSKYEMENYLKRREYPQEEIDVTMHRLHELGFIDDVKFADEWVRSKTATKPAGRRAIRQALGQKGIAREDIENSLMNYSQQSEQQACDSLFHKLAQKHGTDRVGLSKIQRSLLYRGFGYDTIKQAAEHEKEKDEWV